MAKLILLLLKCGELMLCNSCDICTRDLPDVCALSPRATQVICNTSGTLKISPILASIFRPLYIVTGTRCDCGALFHRCHECWVYHNFL